MFQDTFLSVTCSLEEVVWNANSTCFSAGIGLKAFSQEQVWLGSRSPAEKDENDPIISGCPGEGWEAVFLCREVPIILPFVRVMRMAQGLVWLTAPCELYVFYREKSLKVFVYQY